MAAMWVQRIAGGALAIGLLAAPPVAAGVGDTSLAACPAFAWSPPADGGISVSDPAGLDAALAQAQEGGVILLDGGNYGRFSLTGFNPSGEVTIGAADPGDPPVFSGMTIEKSSGIRLAGLTFRIDGTKPFQLDKLDAGLRIRNSRAITVLGSLFTGHIEPPRAVYAIRDVTRETVGSIDFGGLGRGEGLDARGSETIAVLGSTFADLTVGSDLNRIRGAKFIGNTFTGISVDSTDWGGITDLLFEGNLITNNTVPRGLKHADLMQFRFSTSRNVDIRGNVLISARPATHGIYFGGSVFGNYRYDNISITDNLVLVPGRLALAVEHGDGLTITGNRVLSNRDVRGGSAATILVEESSTDVKVANNVANAMGASGRGWVDRPMPGDWVWESNRRVRGPDKPPEIAQAPGCLGK